MVLMCVFTCSFFPIPFFSPIQFFHPLIKRDPIKMSEEVSWLEMLGEEMALKSCMITTGVEMTERIAGQGFLCASVAYMYAIRLFIFVHYVCSALYFFCFSSLESVE
jgi:hypothetical protein